MDVPFLKPFIDGTIRTLKIQCGVEVISCMPTFKEGKVKENMCIAAVVGITSSTFGGSLSISFSEVVFIYLMGQMHRETYTKITPDLHDGAAELLNIIFGQAKIVLNEKGYEIRRAIPTVVRGENIETTHLSPQPVILIPFECTKGRFYIEVTTDRFVFV